MQLFLLIIIVLISLQLVIIDHRYKELIKREEIIATYILRENDVTASEEYIKKLIVEKHILSEEDFKLRIKEYFTPQSLNIYRLSYDEEQNIFMLRNYSTKSIFYYRLTFNNMNPNLTEFTQ